MRIEIRATILAVVTSVSVLALTFGTASFLRSDASRKDTNAVKPALNSIGHVGQGHSLFERNCARCHGDDARGDEGPTLYNLAMSDARIAQRIKEGVKDEMPKFDSKLNDVDIAALIAFLRTLKD